MLKKRNKIKKKKTPHFVGYWNCKLIDPSTLIEGMVKRLVWALCRAYSSLVSNHLINKISAWIRVVTGTNGRDKQRLKQEQAHLITCTALLGVIPVKHTNTHTHTYTS